MNRKLEEKILEQLFGESSPEDSARLREAVARDPEAAKAVADYAEIREGLRALRDIPSHQMSNERLRDAILKQGLRPGAREESFGRKAWRSAGWIWMPAAALVAAFMLTNLLQPSPSAPAGAVALEQASAPSLDFGPTQDFGGLLSEAPTPTPSVLEQANEPQVARADRPRRRTVRANPTPELLASNAPMDEGSDGDPVQEAPMAMAAMAAPAEAVPTVLAQDAPESVVLIQPQKDAASNALVATEVKNADNVVVGG